MTHCIEDRNGAFTMSRLRFYLMASTSGPVVRCWVPGIGWHFAEWDTATGILVAGKPCDPLVLKEVINAL